MSERTFACEIRSLARRLRLPIPARTRLVRELRQDLEGLTAQLVERGSSPDDARRQAAEMLLPDEGTLRELERVGRPWYQRMTASIDPVRLRLAERTLLVCATLAVLAPGTSALLGAGLFRDPSPFLAPVLVTGAVLLVALVAEVFELWVKASHERPRAGLPVIAGLALCTLGIGCAGVLIDLTVLASTLQAAPDDAVARTTAWLVRDAAMLSASIILSVTGGLGWLVLSGWITHVEHDHRRALDAPSPPVAAQTSTLPSHHEKAPS